ncbi:DNA/RNA polymerase [Macrolepiota fuliginosa MF-IS2]|uniref:DNA polymerase n=1 Tax=Macrolepiota fuliginosa MF-IS2 TaxID=1400762 RepID=A0A9P5XN37_9AGAR|nr:DNA/RNA polymerase [Macrolepiota fuliginosa MF-IS2]
MGSAILAVQIHQIDYVLSPPGPLDRSQLPRAPILRIYGQSSTGLQTCLHVHQIYPYCYIEYLGKVHPQNMKRYIRVLRQSLNHAIALSLKRDPSSPKSQYIRAIFLVKGVKFYGFHSQYSPFLKIHLLDPRLMGRVATILKSGSVMSQRFQVYESHLSFILQFMCDFGLYGCGSIRVDEAYRRDEGDVDPQMAQPIMFKPSPYPRQTHMPLELDVVAPAILNRNDLVERRLHHNLVLPGPEGPSEPLVTSVRELWEDERNRRRARGIDPSPELPNDPSEASREVNSGWVAEARWWDEIRSRLEQERSAGQSTDEGASVWEDQVMSVFESTEALWESRYRTWRPGKKESTIHDVKVTHDEQRLSDVEDSTEIGEVDVNETLLVEGAMDQLQEQEGAESDDEERDGHMDEDLEVEAEHEDIVQQGPSGLAGIVEPPVAPSSSNIATLREKDPSKSIPLTGAPRYSSIQLTRAYEQCRKFTQNQYTYARVPPITTDLIAGLESLGLPRKTYRSPFYSNEGDVPERPREFAGLVYNLKGGKGILSADEFVVAPRDPADETLDAKPQFHVQTGWEYASLPPSRRAMKRWLLHERHLRKQSVLQKERRSQIEGPTQLNIYDFKNSLVERAVNTSRDKQNMSIMALEVLAPAHENTVSDPESDPICIAIYGFQVAGTADIHTGIIAIQNVQLNPRRIREFRLDIVDTELDLLNRISDIVFEFDPDILTGWEVQRASWGYLNLRAKHYEFDLQDFLSRAPAQKMGGDDRWGSQTGSSLKVAGRHVLNAWRIMRSEKALTSYTLSNVAFHMLHQRIPWYSTTTLSKWYDSPVPSHMVVLLRYMTTCVCTTLHILEETEVITKTAEFARIFGVDFYSVISRGSQFKVESFMFRIAKPENFVLLSPSKNDVGGQNAAECMPLVMEPISAFYSSPLVVLDFQSLYPSVMIAYNYCYSTCLGRITPFQGKYKFGVTNLDISPSILEALQEYITVAPNGIMYTKSHVRKGLLGRMLIELLDTRVMVKQAMKTAKSDKALMRVLNARQLALKYIANVTYGYTSATYSGRMPAVEIADSIVQTGRETLEKAIDVINGNEKWGAKVVYGDTDSLFVYLPGKTREQAFLIGNEMADVITSQNPIPIKLKFEKVYHPCVLMAKKRYVGFKYESPDEMEPSFDAKGIETVRRDGVLAQRKLVENSLKILFRTQDLSEVKDYCCRSWYKILGNRVPIQDFIFAKEVKMGTYSNKGPPPPGAVIAARRMIIDPNDEPLYGERIPYIITRGEPGTLVAERAMDPLDMASQSHLQLDATYYITRVLIPPLERIFNLVGADVQQWFAEMPKTKNAVLETLLASPGKRKKLIADDDQPASPDGWVIEEHFNNNQCLVCGESAFADLCEECILSSHSSTAVLDAKIGKFEQRLLTAHEICTTCTGIAPGEPVDCESFDCPWLYARRKAEHKSEVIETMDILVDELNSDRFQLQMEDFASEDMRDSATVEIIQEMDE